jgi:hypothetical protein
MHKTEALVNVISITVKKNIKKSWSRETPEEELFLCVLCAKQNLRREKKTTFKDIHLDCAISILKMRMLLQEEYKMMVK